MFVPCLWYTGTGSYIISSMTPTWPLHVSGAWFVPYLWCDLPNFPVCSIMITLVCFIFLGFVRKMCPLLILSCHHIFVYQFLFLADVRIRIFFPDLRSETITWSESGHWRAEKIAFKGLRNHKYEAFFKFTVVNHLFGNFVGRIRICDQFRI